MYDGISTTLEHSIMISMMLLYYFHTLISFGMILHDINKHKMGPQEVFLLTSSLCFMHFYTNNEKLTTHKNKYPSNMLILNMFYAKYI